MGDGRVPRECHTCSFADLIGFYCCLFEFFFVYMGILSAYMSVHRSWVGTHGYQKRALDLLEVGLQTVVK